MKKILLTVAMLLSAAGMQAAAPSYSASGGNVTLYDPIVRKNDGQASRYGIISGALPASVSVPKGETQIFKAPNMGYTPYPIRP